MNDADFQAYLAHVDAFETRQVWRHAHEMSDERQATFRLLIGRVKMLVHALHRHGVLVLRGCYPTLVASVGNHWVGLFWSSVSPDPSDWCLQVTDEADERERLLRLSRDAHEPVTISQAIIILKGLQQLHDVRTEKGDMAGWALLAEWATGLLSQIQPQ